MDLDERHGWGGKGVKDEGKEEVGLGGAGGTREDGKRRKVSFCMPGAHLSQARVSSGSRELVKGRRWVGGGTGSGSGPPLLVPSVTQSSRASLASFDLGDLAQHRDKVADKPVEAKGC